MVSMGLMGLMVRQSKEVKSAEKNHYIKRKMYESNNLIKNAEAVVALLVTQIYLTPRKAQLL